jgi:hypothetical protein
MTAGNELQIARNESKLEMGRPDPAAGRPSEIKQRRNLAVWVALFFFLVWAFFTHSHAGSDNDRSRMAAVESLVQRGTWIIDESPFSRTVDRIFVNDHFYSDKPPLLTFIASGIYAVLHEGFHLSLDASWCDWDESPCHCRAFCDDSPDWAYYLLTLTLIGLPSALMLALFYHITGLLGLDNRAALLLTATLGLTTQIFPYSTVFNSHIPAAACLLGGFYALLRAREGRNAHRWLFGAGLLTALASTLDLGVSLFFVAFLGYALWGHHRRAWPYLLGGLFPIAWMAFLDYQIIGNPLPPYMYTPGYDYPGSRFPQTLAGNRSPDNIMSYGLRLLFGDHGFFALNPVLLWAVVALVWVLRSTPSVESHLPPALVTAGASDHAQVQVGWHDTSRLRGAAALVGFTSSLFALYFILFTDNFGGTAYGPRWYTVFIPLLFLFAAAQWRNQVLSEKPGFWTKRFLFLMLVIISFVNSYQGALNPWREAIPLLRLEHAPSGWREPVDMALSGIAFEDIEPDILSALTNRRVDKRWFDARHCLIIPPGPMWLFVGPETPLAPALAERSGLISGGAQRQTNYVDLRPAWDAYQEQVVTSAWTSPVLAPSDSDPLTPLPLPVDLGGWFAFLGYELQSGELRAGEEIVLITAWQVKGKPEPPLSIFVHLLDPQGRIAGQFDGLGANLDGLYPGDVLLHVHRFSIAPDAPPGRYWLQLGLYNPETMTRLPLQGQETDRLLLTWIDLTD